MTRKLASIQKVENISPIENADNIEQIKVLGWSLVAKKKEFAAGDLCIYFEIDSLLPDHPVFAFLRKNEQEQEFRLKTVRLRGVISQGLALSIDILKEFDTSYQPEKYNIGDDVTEIIGVKKYIPPSAHETNMVIGSFPAFIPKTEQMRLQSFPELIDEIRGKECYITEKLDGTSSTFAFHDSQFIICSRNCILKHDDSHKCVWTQTALKYDLENKLRNLGKSVAIQGEICGPSIQKNKLGLSELSFFVFSIFDIDEQKYLSYNELLEMCQILSLQTVPVLDKSFYLPENIDNYITFFLQLAEGKYPISNKEREGIVVCPKEETYSPILQSRLSFKVISNRFLLKNKEE